MCGRYDLLAKSRADVLASSKVLKVVGQEVKPGMEGRGIFVQGLTPRTIAQEGSAKAKKGRKKEKSVRGWMTFADASKRNLAKDLKAGDRDLRRATIVTMFEILQLSEVVPQEAAKGRRGGRGGRDDGGGGRGKPSEKQMLYSSVTFVDLPGAVRAPSDDAVKKKEDVAITKLQAGLSNCIEMLGQEQAAAAASGKAVGKGAAKKGAKKVVIPWRDSKLTMLLRDKIGGNNLTIMIGAISPAKDSLDDSRRTLAFLRVCGALRQPPMDERVANISVVDGTAPSAEEKERRARERTEKKAAIVQKRKDIRARGEVVYDDDGHVLEDDDDLEDDDGVGLGGLLDDPDALFDTLDGLHADGADESASGGGGWDGEHLHGSYTVPALATAVLALSSSLWRAHGVCVYVVCVCVCVCACVCVCVCVCDCVVQVRTRGSGHMRKRGGHRRAASVRRSALHPCLAPFHRLRASASG